MSAMKHFEQQSYYELLEVPVTASEDQILDAYARAMETYSPDSIAVYTLAEPEQLEALRERLTQAMEVLCALEQRIEYDRKIGVTRSAEELARLRTESLKRAAESTAGSAPAEPVAEVEPEVQAAPAAAEEELPEAEVVSGEVVVTEEVEPEAAGPVAEAQPGAQELASEPPAAVIPPEPVPVAASATAEAPASNVEAPSEPAAEPAPPAPAEPTPAAVPRVPLAAKPGSRSLTPAPVSGLKPAIHARPLAPMTRHGAPMPPPLPPRNGARAPAARPNGQQLGEAPVLAEASAIANAESALALASAKARDSRTRLKTVVDIPSDAEFNGELLRQVREGRNLSLQMLADRTRISSRHVENIEADRYDILPASVYLRGMLMSIARELDLDPLRVSKSYMGLVASGEKKNR
ncbi:MAG TPA: helix-turn-helix domain-containing protein [Archangium sp.]|uniref:helix-turn-helix domain-containing protein n=1 Tax=Archangium sp. TaxID=1872627 RepID=UPI002E3096B5|nr:helix-turn-helix domain-containing protein [Archangium sp.]HEX5745731.1 helix-turn-helix domain-containing protein [Archangium sp.]